MTLLDIPTVPDAGEQFPFQTPWVASAEDTTELVASIFRASDCVQGEWGDWDTGEALLSDRDMLGGLGLAEELCDDVESARAVVFVTAMTWVRVREVEAGAYETGPEVRASEMLESLGDHGTEGWDGKASVAVRAQGVIDMLCQVPTDVPESEQVAVGITWLAGMVTETEDGAREDDVRLLLFVSSCLRRQVLASRPEWRKSVYAEIRALFPAVWSHVATQTTPV